MEPLGEATPLPVAYAPEFWCNIFTGWTSFLFAAVAAAGHMHRQTDAGCPSFSTLIFHDFSMTKK